MKEWHRTTIDDWVAKGMLNKEFILERLDQRIEDGSPFSQEEKSALKRVFDSVCSTDGLLTQAAFISFLQTKSALPRSQEAIQAGKLLYTSLAYLSSLPFPSSPERNASRGLSLKQLTRSLVWVLPGSYSAIIEQGSDSRLRTKADHRRLVFQSLASTTHKIQYDYEDARKIARHDAFEVDWESDLEFCSLNHDDDGDEIYHDLLDVLYSTQEEKSPGLARVPRDAFRPIAKRIATENDVPSLHPIGIPTNQFISLVKLLLALQFESTETEVDLDYFDAAATSICAAFSDHKDTAVITWSAFNCALKDITPYLFDPLYDMLSTSFLEQDPSHYQTGYEPPSEFGDILTLPLVSQLSTFLIGCAYFGDFRRLEHYTPSSLPTPNAFIDAVETAPDEAVIILSGTTKSGDVCTFGVFSREPKADGASVQTNVIPNQVGLEPCSIFQLAPIQDIFRGTPGKPGWTVDSDTVMFGQGGGVVMVLTDGLRRAEIRHHVSERSDSEGVYKPNISRGNWIVELEISQIEIWSEVD
ncbi:uncharacterized protein TRUGW13939_04880 [Talaromyces rugulosus]|uniref:Uncharacterized protein n=1 Tax=Talaromyces rugulosus TaxID=121627 RepID=A0A7H8QUT0_TALRU|nr:uncharacterized protein TRUGW13939_04880 [Talaromyces rugulosus]QKX57760.1 hypothetical protein TRUGW13939_04880 [Talaromyces rugulosus]